MSDSTYSKISETLDNVQAPPGETIPGRILGLHLRLTDAKDLAVLDERKRVAEALEALGAERERAAVAENALHTANIANAELLREIRDLRAEKDRIRAQLDYATDLLTVRRLP